MIRPNCVPSTGILGARRNRRREQCRLRATVACSAARKFLLLRCWLTPWKIAWGCGWSKDLAAHDTIFGAARSSAREWRFGPSPRGAVVRLTPRLLVDDVDTQLQAARAGRGIARPLSYQVADDLAGGTLVRLLREMFR